jgi:hypothetical protein
MDTCPIDTESITDITTAEIKIRKMIENTERFGAIP